MTVRVLEVLSDVRGGAASSVIELARSLKREGFEPTVVSPGGGIEVARRLREWGIAHVELPLGGGHDRGSFSRLRHEMRERKIEVVHTHGRNADLQGGLAAASARIPWIAHLRGLFRNSQGKLTSSWRDKVHRTSLRRVPARILAASGAVRDRALEVLDIPSPRVVSVAPGIELGPFLTESTLQKSATRRQLGLAPQDTAVLSIGPVCYRSGQDVVLDALARLPAWCRPRWIVAGEGRDCEELVARARRSRVDVQMLGERVDIPDLLRACDLFVHPSRWEGVGRAVIEAMATGTPVIASQVGGILEIVEHEQCGLLVPPGNPEALADAIRRLREDSSVARRLAMNGRMRARTRFSNDRGHRVIQSHLRDVVDSGKAKHAS